MVRIMTWNIKTGVGNDPDEPGKHAPRDLERVAQVIRQVSPDVVTLQEVDRNRDRSGYEDQTATLARMLGMEGRFAPNLVDESGEYGIATLSTLPVRDARHVRFNVTHGWEPRGMLEICTTLPDIGDVLIATTHLQYGLPEDEDDALLQRQEAAEILADRFSSAERPVILTGDFNTAPDAPEMAALGFLQDAWRVAGDGLDGMTFPASPFEEAAIRIDGVLVSEQLSISRFELRRDETTRLASDHFPIIVDVN